VGAGYATVRAWVQVFEALYHCFLVQPYPERVARAVRHAPKPYLFDVLRIPTSRLGARIENLTALHLLEACHYWTDTVVGKFDLRFVRDKEQREVDFLVVRDGIPWLLVECQSDEIEPSPALARFAAQLGIRTRPGYERLYAATGLRVLSHERFLAGWA
jgi:uncharacterized protein